MSLISRLQFQLTFAVVFAIANAELIEQLEKPLPKICAEKTSTQELCSLLSLGPTEQGDPGAGVHFTRENAQSFSCKLPPKPWDALAVNWDSNKAQTSSTGTGPPWSAACEDSLSSEMLPSNPSVRDKPHPSPKKVCIREDTHNEKNAQAIMGSYGCCLGRVDLIRIEEYSQWRSTWVTFSNEETPNARPVAISIIAEVMGKTWLSKLGLQHEENKLLDVLELKWFHSKQSVKPHLPIMTVLRQVDHAVKLALHWIAVIHGLCEPPLFDNDLTLREVQIQAFQIMKDFWENLTLWNIGKKEKNSEKEDEKTRAVRHIMSSTSSIRERNSLAWILTFHWIKQMDAKIWKTAWPNMAFHADFKSLVIDISIYQARKDGIDCKSSIKLERDVRLKRNP